MDPTSAILDKMAGKAPPPAGDDDDLDISSVILDKMGAAKGDAGADVDDDADGAGVSAAAESAIGDFADALKSGDRSAALAALKDLLPLLKE